MKKVMLIQIFFILFMFGCKEDSEISSTNNYFKYNGITYQIKYCLKTFESDGFYPNTIAFYFFDKIVKLEIQNDELEIMNIQEIEGFNGISIINPWSNLLDIESGVYSIDTGSDFECSVGLNFSISTKEFNLEMELKTGTFTLENNGNSIKFILEGTTTEGKKLECRYEGEIEKLNF